MQIIELRIEELTPYENNPRNNDNAVESVVQSIREFGFKQPEDIGGIGLTDVWRFPQVQGQERTDAGGHATPKPIKLCARGIVASTRKGENVLDLFGGSGSTLIACEQLFARVFDGVRATLGRCYNPPMGKGDRKNGGAFGRVNGAINGKRQIPKMA